MSTRQPGPSTVPTPPEIECSKIANYDRFMDSLISFMNESASSILQVKTRSGISPGCTAHVKMNQEEKQEKMKSIFLNLSESYKAEANSLIQTTRDTTASSTPCPCPEDTSQSVTTTSARVPVQGRRADPPRPVTTSVRGKIAPPNQFYLPLSPSNYSSTVGQMASSMSSTAATRGTPRGGRGRSLSPYSTVIDTYQSEPQRYRQSRPAPSNYSYGYASNGWCNDCPRDCNTTGGRPQVRTLKTPNKQ